MARLLELDRHETLTVLDFVQELDAGAEDGKLAVPGEPTQPHKVIAGQIGEAPDLLELEEFLAEHSESGSTARFDRGVCDIAEAVFERLAARGLFDEFFSDVGADGLSKLEVFTSAGLEPADFLPAEDLDVISREMCERPLWATPEYFRQLIEVNAWSRFLARWMMPGLDDVIGEVA